MKWLVKTTPTKQWRLVTNTLPSKTLDFVLPLSSLAPLLSFLTIFSLQNACVKTLPKLKLLSQLCPLLRHHAILTHTIPSLPGMWTYLLHDLDYCARLSSQSILHFNACKDGVNISLTWIIVSFSCRYFCRLRPSVQWRYTSVILALQSSKIWLKPLIINSLVHQRIIAFCSSSVVLIPWW